MTFIIPFTFSCIQTLPSTDEPFIIMIKHDNMGSFITKSNCDIISDIVILYRTNAQSRVFESELLKANIPFRIVGSFYFYSRKEIKDLLTKIK